MNSKRSITVACVLFVVAICSSRPAYGAPPDPCSLLTQARVSAALGTNAGTGQHRGAKACEWFAASQAALNGKKVTLTLQDGETFAYAEMPVDGMTKTPVSGIGDGAVYGKTASSGTVLTVKKGSTVFAVYVTGFSDEQTKAKEKSLALEIVSKL